MSGPGRTIAPAHRNTVGPADAAMVDALCARVADVPGDVREIVERHVGAVAPLVHGPARDRLIAAAIARLAGLDALDLLLADPSVDEVLVNRGGEVWTERFGRLERSGTIPEQTVPVVLERVLAPLGRRLDRTDPIVDARLPDGSRVCAVVAPVAVDGTTVSIRRMARTTRPLAEFAPPDVAAVVAGLVDRRCNLVVSGATSSGKTSLLASLLDLVPRDERIVVLEDTTELTTPDGHVVRLEARAATADGVRAVPLHELVRTALRLRPDRLVVGEVRGDEVLAMVQAMNTGHDGSLSTCHANSVIDTLGRLETLVLQAAPSWPLDAVRRQLSRSIDAIIHVARGPGGARRIVAIGEVCEDAHARPIDEATDGTGDRSIEKNIGRDVDGTGDRSIEKIIGRDVDGTDDTAIDPAERITSASSGFDALASILRVRPLVTAGRVIGEPQRSRAATR